MCGLMGGWLMMGVWVFGWWMVDDGWLLVLVLVLAGDR